MVRPSGILSPSGHTRERLYRYVCDRLRHGSPPTLREIQEAMGLRSLGAVQDHMRILVESGKLIKEPGRARGYRLPHQERLMPSTVAVPLLGEVQAGNLTLALETPEGYIAVQSRTRVEELFALRVNGKSMVGAGIFPGDIVIVRRQKSADNGDIVVALIEDEATIKRLQLRKNQMSLVPANPHFKPIVVNADSLVLLGKVIQLRRTFD